MLRVTIDINGEIIHQIHAVRTNPKTKTVKNGTICTYDIVYKGVTVDTMKGRYGCGVDLAIKLLERFKENSAIYSMLAKAKIMEK